MKSPVELIPQLAGHIIAAGGKRLRPMLTLAAARLCGYRAAAGRTRRPVALAAAVEFIHTATLLHDDVVDASDLRRGLATANAVWGNKPSVLVGDFLFSRAFQLMVEDGSLRVLEILANASAVIAEGEVAQLVTANDTDTSEAAYLEVIQSKTAQLFAAASQIGGVLEPVGALPVIIEDEVLVGGNCGVYEGTVVRRRAVLAAGVILTRGTPVFDLVRETTYRAAADEPLEVPEGAVVVPGARAIRAGWGAAEGLSLQTPVVVKYRDEQTDLATALESWLR
jgi:hypothetical protein